MSELIESRRQKRDILKHAILQLHKGEAPEQVRTQIARLLGEVPYDDVVAVEQQLIAEGLPVEEILRLCDLHAAVLEGRITHEKAPPAPPGHPVDVFRQENRLLRGETALLRATAARLLEESDPTARKPLLDGLLMRVRALLDVDKHYKRKENLLFPYLEKHGISGPPTVMWGKHDETRAKLKAAHEVVVALDPQDSGALGAAVDGALLPAADAIDDMATREEEILLPMCLDTLEEVEWFEIHRQGPEIGYCLYDPPTDWRPERLAEESGKPIGTTGRIRLASGSLSLAELEALLNTIPFDLTFVDADDTVRYFTQGRERIFARNRAILGRKVQYCHPPHSVDTVQRILDDFRAGREDRAPFWIEMRGRFIHIEYFALRDAQGRYLGTLEVSQDLTEKRALTGEQRLLSYAGDDSGSAETANSHPADDTATAGVPPTSGVRTIDARPLLARGEHPLQLVMGALAELGGGDSLRLITPFVPHPLIEKARAAGFAATTEETSPGCFETLFRAQG